MKNSKLVKIVLIMIISLSVMIVAKNSLAADTDLTNTLTGNSTTGSNMITITGNNTISNTTSNATSNTTNTTVLTTNNTSNYNNTSLPKTGVGDSIPGIALVVVLGISALYAYKKMQDYKNI